ncbi:hypothetical protein Cgig2_005214 [Carnegiea gigantea]|uniref:BED-type domain-containing protein n=1 Tax=Carnegiea gigantea TaxID=171969 RepID=A0A9Q1JVC7_9CARY|nr:hypothetical protein Cgig2_005214 [Carnegiea gigantea]
MTRCCGSSDPIDVDSMHGESCTPSERDNVATKNNPEHGSGHTTDVDIESGHKRKLTSSVWDHFERKMMKGKMRAICSRCKKDFVGDSKSRTTHLRDHLKRCFKVKNQVNVRQSILRATVKMDSSSSKVNSTHESPSKHMESNVSYGKRPLNEIDDYENLWDKHVLEIPPKTTCRSEVETFF